MKKYNLFCLFIAMLHTMHGMEQSLSITTEKRTLTIINQLNALKNVSTFKKYEPLIKDMEAKLCSSNNNKLDIVEYALQMINQESIDRQESIDWRDNIDSIDTIIFTITERNIRLKNKINILNELHNLPYPNLFQETSEKKSSSIVEKNKMEYLYWSNGKERIKANLEIKYKEYICEKQKKILDNKQKRHQEISLQEWKEYLLSLLEYNNVIDSIVAKQEVKKIIRNTQRIVTTEETKSLLKQMVCDIRQFKTADTQELMDYKITLEKYISLLPENFDEKPAYTETMQLVSQRIQLLKKIDHELKLNYCFCTNQELKDLSEYLKKLQAQLNKPSSERHIQLDEKIKQTELLQQKESKKS